MGLESITIALDWTLNTNHTGFVVAKALRYYEKEGLQVNLIEPGVPYVTPAERVRDGSATFAVAPSETAISSRTQKDKPMLQVAVHCKKSAILSAFSPLYIAFIGFLCPRYREMPYSYRRHALRRLSQPCYRRTPVQLSR